MGTEIRKSYYTSCQFSHLVKLNDPLMGTEIYWYSSIIVCIDTHLVKLNDPLMGTEINKKINSIVSNIRIVKLNDPLMGTEI